MYELSFDGISDVWAQQAVHLALEALGLHPPQWLQQRHREGTQQPSVHRWFLLHIFPQDKNGRCFSLNWNFNDLVSNVSREYSHGETASLRWSALGLCGDPDLRRKITLSPITKGSVWAVGQSLSVWWPDIKVWVSLKQPHHLPYRARLIQQSRYGRRPISTLCPHPAPQEWKISQRFLLYRLPSHRLYSNHPVFKIQHNWLGSLLATTFVPTCFQVTSIRLCDPKSPIYKLLGNHSSTAISFAIKHISVNKG